MKLFHELTHQLSSVYPHGEASALARLVFEDRFALSLADLMLDKDNDLSAYDRQELQNIAERLLQKEPVQYVLGHTCFCGMEFDVRPGVLIPRPETEELVSWIVDECGKPACPVGAPKVLDIGTGSGCIAVSLAKNGFLAEGWDISPEALEVARCNADKLGVEVYFILKDILQIEEKEAVQENYDVIVSNPPYICHREAREMDANVLDYEPQIALFVPDSDPLIFYRYIVRFACRHLSSGGRLYFEINRAYGKEACEMLEDMCFCEVELRKDQYDNPRMVRAVWKGGR